MHELSITRNIVEIVCQHAGDRPVGRVRLAVGRLSAVMPDALHYCFDVVSRNTVLDGATLEIEEIDGQAECLVCGTLFPMPVGGARCACGRREHRLLAGQELKIIEMEISRRAS